MRTVELVLRSRRVVLDGDISPATVAVRDGIIWRVERGEGTGASLGAASVLDVGDAVVMPGVVDVHVHVNEPGRAEWEGFESAGAAAAAGGITTLVDMPLNSSPVTTALPALRAKVAAAAKCRVDHGFWGGVVPGNRKALGELVEGGVLGFKCFLVDSGIEEFPPVEEADLRPAMAFLGERGFPLLAHAELPGPMRVARARAWPEGGRRYADYLASRPPEAEVQAVELLVRLARETGCPVHVVHVSAAEALEPLARAREEGLPVTAETCPHYLTFAAEEVPDGATAFKCAPPIRDAGNRERLWEGLAEGTLELVASDHSPCPPELKRPGSGDFRAAWGGISSLQLLLPAVWTEARRRGHGLAEVAAWLCEGPARLAGLEGRKGRIAEGHDADLVVWDPEESFRVEPERLLHRHRMTPYEGRTLSGRVLRTYVRGRPVFEEEAPVSAAAGRWVRGREA